MNRKGSGIGAPNGKWLSSLLIFLGNEKQIIMKEQKLSAYMNCKADNRKPTKFTVSSSGNNNSHQSSRYLFLFVTHRRSKYSSF